MRENKESKQLIKLLKYLIPSYTHHWIASIFLVVVWFQPFWVEKDQVGKKEIKSPITVELTEKKGFATFTNLQHPDNRVGYRFFEHEPLVFGTVPKNEKEAGIVFKMQEKMVQEISVIPGTLVYERKIEETNQWLEQDWIFYMAPVEDGIDLLWVIETNERGLPLYYGVQQ